VRKIVAYRFSAFGDVAMTVPVLKAVLAQNPNLEVVMVSLKHMAPLFEGIERLTFHGIAAAEFDGVLPILKLARRLKKQFQPDLVIDLHDVIRSKILSLGFRLMLCPRVRIYKGRDEKKALIAPENVHKKALQATTERYADCFRKAGFPVTLSHQLSTQNQAKKGIGLAPFAQHQGKMMPLEMSFELAKSLAKSHHVYLFGGGAKEKELMESWAQQIPNTQSVVGQLDLKAELSLIASLEVMISMDSANMHLASVVGTRCISVWGATHHFAGFLGYGQSLDDVVQVRDLTCRPCSVFGDKTCFRGDWACLNYLDIHSILAKI
jgi:ADP-heptose:LPS heptosyltransferase